MWRCCGILSLGLLAACNGPSLPFRGVPAVRQAAMGSTFDVRIRGNRAEALRISPEAFPAYPVVAERAAAAIEAVSGCEATEITGDPSMLRATLHCAGGRPARSAPGSLRCEGSLYRSRNPLTDEITLECRE